VKNQQKLEKTLWNRRYLEGRCDIFYQVCAFTAQTVRRWFKSEQIPICEADFIWICEVLRRMSSTVASDT